MARALRHSVVSASTRTLCPAKPPRRQPSRDPPVANPTHAPAASPWLTRRANSASKRLVAWREDCKLWDLRHKSKSWQRRLAKQLIGLPCGVAAYASSAQHRGKAPRRARSCWLPHTKTARCSSASRRGSNPGGSKPRAAGPNPSVKPSPNGGPPGPGHRYGVHFLWPGPGVPPSVPAYLER